MARKRAEAIDAKGLASLGNSDEVRISNHSSAAGLANAARGMLTQVDDRIIQSLPKITVPTLVLVGENDTQFLAATDYMALKIPDATKEIIPHAGHAANINQPELFNRAVLNFITGIGL